MLKKSELTWFLTIAVAKIITVHLYVSILEKHKNYFILTIFSNNNCSQVKMLLPTNMG